MRNGEIVMQLTEQQQQFKQNVVDLLKGSKRFMSKVNGGFTLGEDIQVPIMNRRPANFMLTAQEMLLVLKSLELLQEEPYENYKGFYQELAEELVAMPYEIDEEALILNTDNKHQAFNALPVFVSATLRILDISDSEFISLLVSKNVNYGNSFDKVVDKYQTPGMLIRFTDKFNRLEQLVEGNSVDMVGEAIEDTLLDIAGYAMLTLNYMLTQGGNQ
jgi:hypothetical protein